MKRIIFPKEETVRNEIRDLAIAIVVITLVFSYPNFSQIHYYFVAVISAFLFHELAHRFVARKFGAIAFFKLWPEGVLFALLFMLLGIKFVALGAVMIYPYAFGRWGYRIIHLTESESGLIAASGPVTNLFFAVFFSFFTGNFFEFLSLVNAWIAFFNLLPVPPLDGSRVLRWKPWVWLVLLVLSGTMVFL